MEAGFGGESDAPSAAAGPRDGAVEKPIMVETADALGILYAGKDDVRAAR